MQPTGIEMNYKKKIETLADKYQLQLIYAFGSRAKEILNTVEGKKSLSTTSNSDLDIGIKSEKPLSVQKKVEIPEAPVILALDIVQGELLYAQDENFEAEYQLYIMRKAADLMPYERLKQKIILGI